LPLPARLLIVCLLAAACTSASFAAACRGEGAGARNPQPRPLPLKLDEAGRHQRRPPAVGAAAFRWTAQFAPSFGGWSDLHVTPDGHTLTSISDEGSWFTAHGLPTTRMAIWQGLSNGQIGKLLGPRRPGRSFGKGEGRRRRHGHACPTASWLVSFERHHRLLALPDADLDAGSRSVARPISAGQPSNGGNRDADGGSPDGPHHRESARNTACDRARWSAGSANRPEAVATSGRTFEYVKTPGLQSDGDCQVCPTDRLPSSNAPSTSCAAVRWPA